MADSAVNNKSDSTENDQLSCSTSSLTPVNNVLIDTSNLHDKSKSLLKDESPVQQVEHINGVEHESPKQQNIESVEPKSPMQQKIESVEPKSPMQQNIESVEPKSPMQQNIESVEPKSPMQQNIESVEPKSPMQQNIESVEPKSPIPTNEKKNDFEIGDIVWAKIGRYPFWPSIVCIDPETNVYIKGSLQNKRQFSLHVRFCNDQGRRSWAKTVEMYSGKEALLSKYPNGLALIKNSKKQMTVWDLAVKEADKWLKVNRDDRMIRFARSNGLNRSKISGLGPKPPSAPTPSKSTALTPQEFLEMQKALKASCQPSTSGSQGNCVASTSGSNMPQCYVPLKDIKKKSSRKRKEDDEDEERAVALPRVTLPLPEPPKPKPAKRKYVDVQKIQLREALKKKKAKRALQIKKYGFSYSSSEYESTDDEAVPLVPFNPNRKVLESIKYAVANLESEGMQRIKEKRILIKAIRLAERRTSKKNKEEEEEEQEEQEQKKQEQKQ